MSMIVITEERRRRCATSVVKRAMPTLVGTAINSAIAATTTLP